MLARDFSTAFGLTIPVVADKPGIDAFDRAFAAWPFRFYAIQMQQRAGIGGFDGTLLFKAQPGGKYPHAYAPEEIVNFLMTYC